MKIVYKQAHFGVRVNLPYASSADPFRAGLVCPQDFRWRASCLLHIARKS